MSPDHTDEEDERQAPASERSKIKLTSTTTVGSVTVQTTIVGVDSPDGRRRLHGLDDLLGITEHLDGDEPA